FSCTPPARTSIQTISLHDALPILEEGLRGPEGTRGGLEEGALLSPSSSPPLPNAAIAGILLYAPQNQVFRALAAFVRSYAGLEEDRKSTRLNSSHVKISYAVFCLQ